MHCIPNFFTPLSLANLYASTIFSFGTPNFESFPPVTIWEKAPFPNPGFSLKDILAGLRQCEDVLNNDSNTVVITFMTRIRGPGTGVLPASCTELRTDTKTMSGKLSLVLSKA